MSYSPPLSDPYRELIPAVAEVVPIAVFSGHTRLVKPDALSFVSACAVLNAVPTDVLLVDDSAANRSDGESRPSNASLPKFPGTREVLGSRASARQLTGVCLASPCF